MLANVIEDAAKTTAFVISLVCLTMLSEPCFSRDAATPQDDEQSNVMGGGNMSAWLRSRFSQAELEGLQPGELKMESSSCSCYDFPKHFPYSVVLLKTPKGDLIARADGGDEAVRFTVLAVRFGDRYCKMESEEGCYGTFSHPCDFTDFRYGPYLAAFFPTCKSDED